MIGLHVPLTRASQARGKNGWFTPAYLYVAKSSAALGEPRPIEINIESSRPYRSVAAIHLELTMADATTLMETLARVLGWTE